MTGLKVVDDNTFTIKTTEKVSNLPVRARLLGLRAAARRVLHGPQGVRRQAGRHRPVQARLVDQGAGDRPVQVQRLLGRVRRPARQGHLQDLPGPRRRLQRRHRQQPRHHRRDPGERPDRRQVQDRTCPTATRRRRPVASSRRSPSPGPRSTRATPTRGSGRRSPWRSTATPSSSRSSTAPASPPPAGSPRSSTATRPGSAASAASTTRPRPRRCSTRPAATSATS